jgi:DNA-directed RNA polymerase sigma subunit (sigma70/sigma32)
LSAAGITKTSRSIIDALQGKNAANRSWVGAVVDGASGSVRISKNGKAVLTDAEWQRHFASRDAGVYAELLLALRPGEGQQLAVQQLIDNLITRAKLRGRLRKVAEKNPHPLRGFSEYSTLSADRLADSRQEHLADKRAMNPDIETQDGRTQLVTRLVGRAALLTDGEALLLQDIAEDGRLAVAELCDRNVALCYYAAATVRHKLNDAHMYGLVPAAFEGLRGAVTRFDPALGFVFSSFAVRTMEGHMARSATKDLAARTGITASAWTRIFSIRKTESRLSQELGRQPTEEEIVASGIYAVRTVESLRSYREKEAYATRRSYALDLSSPRYADGGHMNEEAVGLAEYTSAQTAADSNEDLSEALEAAFVAAGLSDYEQTMQKRLHGLHPFAVPLTPDELAVELGVEPKLVKNQLRQAYKKIVDSPEAGSVLAKFLRRND